MDLITIVVLGVVATVYTLGIEAAAVRLGLVRGNMIGAVGALIIPEPIRSLWTRVGFNIIMGIAFTAAYSYLFVALSLHGLRDFLSIGALVGFVHGFFVSFFILFGLSAFLTRAEYKPFTASSAVVNTLSHVVFGALVGLGLGYRELDGSVMRYATFLALVAIAAGGLLVLLVPHRLRQLSVTVNRKGA